MFDGKQANAEWEKIHEEIVFLCSIQHTQLAVLGRQLTWGFVQISPQDFHHALWEVKTEVLLSSFY